MTKLMTELTRRHVFAGAAAATAALSPLSPRPAAAAAPLSNTQASG